MVHIKASNSACRGDRKTLVFLVSIKSSKPSNVLYQPWSEKWFLYFQEPFVKHHLLTLRGVFCTLLHCVDNIWVLLWSFFICASFHSVICAFFIQPTQVNREDLYQNHWKSYYWVPSICISLNPRKMMVLYIMCNPRKLIIHIRINWLHRKMTWVCWYLWESPHFYGWRKLKEDMINRLFCSTSFTPYITFYSSIF